MSNNPIHKAFQDGGKHQRWHIGIDLLNDRFHFLKGVFQQAPRETPEQKAFAEGIRVALNILKSRGEPQEDFDNIINPDFPPFKVGIVIDGH